MYAAIRQTKLKPGTAEEVVKRAREGALPLISGVPGFKAYYMVLSDDNNSLTTVSVFADKASAEACNAKVMDWIKQNMGPYVAAPTQAMEGRVAISKP
jgi:heme-degrading monooxygenase HmoA